MAFQIAIDGPVAAGKGTISRLLAEKLGFLYVDTGAMYRVTALIAQRQNIPPSEEAALAEAVTVAKIEMRNPNENEQDGRLTTVLLDGEDVSWLIRTEEISKGASLVAQLPLIRKALVIKQQEIAKHQPFIVMEGRDITYRVLPEANLKIFLTASDQVRAKRRHVQLLGIGSTMTFEEVLAELVDRDHRDMTRSVDPLQIVEGAWVIDTSDMDIDQEVDLIAAKVRKMQAEAGE